MPHTATHILIVIILVELFRNYFVKNNKKFPRYYILIAATGAILPDFDIVVYYITYFFGFTIEQIHRTFLHTLFIPLILFFVGLFTYAEKIKNSRIGKMHMHLPTIFFILSFGSLIHLILDALIIGNIIPFYPFSAYSIGINLISVFPEAWKNLILPSLDTLMLVFWLFWMEFKLKITNYF